MVLPFINLAKAFTVLIRSFLGIYFLKFVPIASLGIYSVTLVTAGEIYSISPFLSKIQIES